MERAGSTIMVAVTVNVSVAVFPIPPFVEDTGPLVLVRVPVVDATTFTMIVQSPPPVIVPPLKLIPFPPETAVIVPPQLLARLSGDALTTPLG